MARSIALARTVAALAVAALLIAVAPAGAQAATGTISRAYVTVDDGTSIALCIWKPAAAATRRLPALFEMDGYQGCPAPNDNEFFGATKKYVVVYAQIRGTGCSGGQLDLFSKRSSLDGKYIIDKWISKQPWSNRRVGITGHSYGGLTGFLVAATSPHVQAVAVSGLIDDFYRSILYMGGIFDEGFPVAWGAALRPYTEVSGNTSNYGSDPTCVANQAQHQGSDTVPAQLIVPAYTQTTATAASWAITHSLSLVESGLNAPIQINQQYQDEQTGPRGGYILWQHVPAWLPKRLVISNGQHNPNDPAMDKGAWLDCWLIDRGHHCPAVTGETATRRRVRVVVNAPAYRVLMYFDSLRRGTNGQTRNTPYLTSDWPAPETRWTTYYLHAAGALSPSATGGDGQASYVSTSTSPQTTGTLGDPIGNPPSDNIGSVTFASGPHEATFTLPFARTTAISGPILLNLWMTSTATDTDVFVDLLDRDNATGQVEYLQRGLMRASFRAVNAARSDRIRSGPLKGTIYRPYHDFLKGQLLTPAQPFDLSVEIFPVGHVFYPGHTLVMDVHAPPLNDPISTYAYEPLQAPAINSILQDPQHRSTLLLPLMPKLPPLWAKTPVCSQIAGYVCFTAN